MIFSFNIKWKEKFLKIHKDDSIFKSSTWNNKSTVYHCFFYLFVFNLTITVNQKIHFTQEIQRTCFYDHSISEQNIC